MLQEAGIELYKRYNPLMMTLQEPFLQNNLVLITRCSQSISNTQGDLLGLYVTNAHTTLPALVWVNFCATITSILQLFMQVGEGGLGTTILLHLSK